MRVGEFGGSLKMRDALEIKGLGNFDRKTGELWLEDAGFARFISYRSRMVAREKERNRTCAPSLLGRKRILGPPGGPHAFILRQVGLVAVKHRTKGSKI